MISKELQSALYDLHLNYDEYGPSYKLVSNAKSNRGENSLLQQVLCNTALTPLHKDTYMFRYTMELCENVYRDTTENRRRLAREFNRFGFNRVANLIIKHYRQYPLSEGTTARCRFDLWMDLISLNLKSILERCRRVGIQSAPRLLTLGECMHLTLELPAELCGTGIVRTVNTFSERVLHTRLTPAVSEQKNLDLRSVVGVHVCGIRERSGVARTNGSLAMSATDDGHRGIQYGLFYAQLLPCCVWVDIDPLHVVSTPEVLKACGGGSWHTAMNISTHHNEYIPTTVSYIPDIAVKRIVPVWFEGMEIRTGPLLLDDFQEAWMTHEKKRHFMSTELVEQLETIVDTRGRLDSYGSPFVERIAGRCGRPSKRARRV